VNLPAPWTFKAPAGALLLVSILSACTPGGNGGGDGNGEADGCSNCRGTFLTWEPVDDARGYAYFTVTNNGSTTATATCTVTVRNDFGNFGFDILVGETIAPGQTINGKMAISVGEGSFLINQGEVTDC
jgi:hypothetical protein